MKLLFGILTTWAMVLTSRQTCVFGELTILRDAPIGSETNSNIFTRSLTCVSGDDSSALVWNLDSTDNENPTTLQKFVDSHTEPIGIKCPLNETGGCMSEWNTNYWSITNSFEKPMGPVMDKRWEDFEDIVFTGDKHDKKTIKVQDSGAMIFSVRGTITVKILLSRSFDDGSPCYLIVIDGRKGEASFICEHVWENDGQQTPGRKCLKTKSPKKHEESPLSPMEWRTFILKWSKENKAVTVYDEKERIISQTFTEWHNINSVSFFRGSHTTRYRFHEYNYLHTTKKNAHLLSPWIHVKDPTFCFEMLIGLCAACEAVINFKAHDGPESRSYVLENVKSERHSKGDGLPVWQHVRFNQSYNKSHGNYVKLRIRVHSSGNDTNPLWALANFQMCKDKETVRRSSIKIKQVLSEKNQKLWPKVNCQKLSYSGGSLVSSDSDVQPELKHGMPLCERGRVGPNCAIYCSLISVDASCRNLAICIDKGCVCAQGWQGRNCDTGCKNKFGYNCELPCGNCKYATICDAGSGTCSGTCEGNSIPPYCEELETPDVVSVNETSAVVALHVKRYDKRLNYTLWVQQEGNRAGYFVKKDNGSWKNTSTLEFVIDDLKPETLYVVSGVQFHPGTYSRYQGPRRNFTTHCNHMTSSTEYSVTINGEDRKSTTSMRTTDGAKNETAPPPVGNLDIYERNINEVLLRWVPPEPNNGEIENYGLSLCTTSFCDIPIIILPSQTCKLWKNYICYEAEHPNGTNVYKFQVWAKYKGIEKLGIKSTIGFGHNSREESEAPEYLTTEMLGKGVVILQWPHPWKTNRKIDTFIITIEILSSDLQGDRNETTYSEVNHAVIEYEVNYIKALYLEPSTMYKFTVFANSVDRRNGKRVCENASTPPALHFENRLELANNQTNHTILVELPSISNNTIDSVMHIIVKGGDPCEERNTLRDTLKCFITLTESEYAWIAASLKTEEMKEQNFTIGDNQTYNGILNCPLKLGETYDIVVIVEGGMKPTENMTIVSNVLRVILPTGSTKPSPEWLFAIPIIAALILMTYYAYRKRRVIMEAMNYSYITPLSRGRVNSNDSYVVPRQPRRPLSSIIRPQSREGPPHATYLELIGGACNTPAEYDYINLVKIEKFENYVKEAALNGFLEKEYAMFPRGQMKSWDHGKLQQNQAKNRYGDLLPYDEGRVILRKLPGNPHSDYINASYIQGYKREKAYIATQGPMNQTINDFWRMIWQEDVRNICLLSNVIEDGKTKCEQYWPEIGSGMKYGGVYVNNIGQKILADYTLRTLHVTYRQRTRKIEHLHYTAWPDHALPMFSHSIVSFLKKVLTLSLGDGPIVVQSSAGVGRTGIIILCDICLRGAAAEGIVDVFGEAQKLRRQRTNMVNNLHQYLLAHLMIAECLLAPQTALTCDEDLPKKIHDMKKRINIQEQRLRECAWQDEILRPYETQKPLSTRDVQRNRFPNIAPARNSSISLKTYPESDESISVVHVDGVKLKDQYIATQLPLPSTLSDFWRMITEQNVELIIMLQLPDPKDSTSCEIIQGREFELVPYLKVTALTESDAEFYTMQKILLSDSSQESTRKRRVTILKCKGWDLCWRGQPPPPKTLVELWRASETIPRDGPTVAVCHDGLTGCGLYLALGCLLERMAVEHECDVFTAIRGVRRSRPQFVQTLTQIEYLYNAAETYAKSFATYANFQ